MTTRPQDAELLERVNKKRQQGQVVAQASHERVDEERVLTRIFQEKVRVSSDNEKTIAQMLTELDELKKCCILNKYSCMDYAE